MTKQKIQAAPSIRRLPSYLHLIKDAKTNGIEFISGTQIAEELKLEAIQVRKDLTLTGIVGIPKRGYPVQPLIDAIENFLGWNRENVAFVVGVGSLGKAISGYHGFREHGLNICAAFDSDKKKIGKVIHGVSIFDLLELPQKAAEFKPLIAILTLPTEYAQDAADILVNAGIKAIWNFTNSKINVPDDVLVQKEDLSTGYAMLRVMINKNGLK